MSTENTDFEIFISYARRDNAPAVAGGEGSVTALSRHILEDHRRFSTEPLRIFFDVHEITDEGSRFAAPASLSKWLHCLILGGSGLLRGRFVPLVPGISVRGFAL